jgi:hypothetical protein
VRGDLADVRLADQVFAPHSAAPIACLLNRAAPLRAEREEQSQSLAQLAAGDPFETLELAGDNAWGVAPSLGLVGYVDRTALDRQGGA